MTGKVTISIEVELGWGYHDLPVRERELRLSDGRRKETRTLEKLLKLCDDYDLPVTFDLVGHLLLDSCGGRHGNGHRDGWFGADPGTGTESDPLFYAPDLVRGIVESTADHEIATHTFSHISCVNEPDEVLAWELEQVRDLHLEWGIEPPRSIVPPRHESVSRRILSDHGIDILRNQVDVSGLFKLYHWADHRWQPTRAPEERKGILTSFSTHSLTSPLLRNGQERPAAPFRVLPTRVRQAMHERYLEQGIVAASRRDDFVHYWTHLHNISNNEQWGPVSRFLSTLAERRNAGAVDVVRMCDLTE